MKHDTGAIVLKASLLKTAEMKSGHAICFRAHAMTEEQENEIEELAKLKGERLYLIVVTEEEYGDITGERH